MYAYCVESFAHIECYSDCSRRGEALWLNPFSTVLFSMCSAITVECYVLYPCCMGVLGIFAVCKEEGFLQCFLKFTERRDMGLYEVPLSVSLLGFGIGLC